MRPIWKGAITFGLISIPVRLYSAVQEKSLKFHMLHDEEDGGRIKYKRTAPSAARRSPGTTSSRATSTRRTTT